MKQAKHGGGWRAVRYASRLALKVGPIRFWRAMRAKNACKTCAFGMGGQLGGMRNEAGHFPEVCKKSMQAMAADMRGRIDPKFFETYSIEQLRACTPREMEAFGRLADPVIAESGATHYRTVSWEYALERVATDLSRTLPEKAFFYASGRSSIEAGFLLQLLARIFGTNHVNNCSYYCHQASGVGLKDSIGVGTATIEFEDLGKCDLLFLIGGNPASNHPRLMSVLAELRRRGGKVIVVNPIRESGLQNFRIPSNARSMLFGSEIASVYLQPTIGGDLALLAGIAKKVIEMGAVDVAFVSSATEGYAELKALLATTNWEDIERASGLPRSEIEQVAEIYAESERTVFSWTMGITHHLYGTENVQWIANLALLRGMVGKEGAGLMPIRGHSNVQGMGTVGVTPAMSKAAVDGFERLGLKPPSLTGYDTLSAMEAADRGEMSLAICLGGNLYGANPDSRFAQGALGRVDTVVYLSTALNTGHAHGTGKSTIILPVRARDEESQTTTQESMFNFVRLSDGGPERHPGTRSEVEVIAEIGERWSQATGATQRDIDWIKLRSHDEIRALVARLAPNLAKIERIGQTKEEFHIPGRILHTSSFATPNGRARFRPHGIPLIEELGERQLRLMTIRSEGQFNTVVYDEDDIYRGQERRDVILMSVSDMKRLAIRPDQLVEITSETGSMRVYARPIDISLGCAAMYYPEANVLVSRASDPRSRTPAFKSVLVRVQPV